MSITEKSSMRKIKTDEEKAATKIETLLSDLRLDIDEIGFYVAEFSPTIIYNRLLLLTEAAEFAKEEKNDIREY
jgi:hypothetical protein